MLLLKIAKTTTASGCFGNANYGILNVTFKNCQNHGSFTGKNSGGICAGGDCSSGCLGGGCFGNYNTATGIINVAFKNCKNYGSLTGKNSGGVCAGGDNTSIYVSGGGCFANYNNGDINVSFLKCKNKGSFGTADNAGGICAGGDNNNGSSIGSGCFGNFNKLDSTINVKIIDCTNSGNFNGKNTGGICGGGDNYLIGGGCFGHYNQGNINVDILNNINSGSFSGINSGGICAGGNTIIGTNLNVFGTGCFGNYNNGLLNVNFKNCHNSGLFANGFANCGGICGGGQAIGTINNYYAYGFGCFGNANRTNGIINVKFINCTNSGALSGKNSGGICAGGDVDVQHSYGGGCFGNFNSGNLTVLYKKCYNSGSFDETSLNVGGICAGGDISNTKNNIFGGGCFANYNTTTGIINVAFDSCQNSGKLNGKNAGGICAGGDCNPILTLNLSYVKGGGCFGNASLGKINVLFTKCKNSGKFNGISSGGICGGGNNTYQIGGGCFANYISGESFFNIKFNDCHNSGSLNGNNSGGICAGGNNGGCFGNNNQSGRLTVSFYNCTNHGSFNDKNSAGICGGGDVITGSNGAGCFSNYNNGSTKVTFKNCTNYGSYKGTGSNCAGICAGGDNNKDNATLVTLVSGITLSIASVCGAGCFGNFNFNYLNVSFINCKNNGNFKFYANGDNSAGICAGGNNIIANINVSNSIQGHDLNYSCGAGCFGNFNTGHIITNFKNCENNGYFKNNGKNSAGICAGGDNIYSNGTVTNHSSTVIRLCSGGGCFGNVNNGIISTHFTNCRNNNLIHPSKNCAGICAGGDNIYGNVPFGGYGAGGFANYALNSSTNSTIFSNCYSLFNIKGENNGGLVAGGNVYFNSVLQNTNGCFGNENSDNSVLYVKILNSTTEGELKGVHSGGFFSSGVFHNSHNANLYISQSRNLSDIITNGGLLAGNVSAIDNSNILIENCYTKGTITRGSAGFVGTNTVGYGNQTNLTIKNSYARGKYYSSSYPLLDLSLNGVIINCYYGHSLRKIINSLSLLPEEYWIKTRDFPKLKYI